MASDRSNLSRRQLLSIAGGALGVVAAGTLRVHDLRSKPGAATGSANAPRKSSGATAAKTNQPAEAMRDKFQPAAASPEALALLGGVSVGTTIAEWTVAAIYDFHLGAVPVVLSTGNGKRYQVDVLRRDDSPGAPRGIDETRHLSFFLSNEGDGSTASDEKHGLGLMALAAMVRRGESENAPTGLLTLAERAAMHPRAGYKVPV